MEEKNIMEDSNVWVGSWRPHRPRGPIAAANKGPGPKYALPPTLGINNHDPSRTRAPAFMFGIRHLECSESHSPGPIYLIPSDTIRTGKGGSPAYSIYGRPKHLKPFETPGPGSYSSEKVAAIFPSSPQYSMHERTKLLEKYPTPGPDKYTLPPVLGPKTVTVKTAPSALIAERLERGHFCEDLKKTPGPGTYNVVETNIYQKRSPQYSIILRNPLPESKTQYPGPDKYTLPPVLGPKTVTVRTAPSALIAERLERGHFCEDLKKTPGPGTYSVVETNIYKNRSPQYSIILRNPLPESKTQYPGPDKYTLPPVLGPKTVTVRTAPSALIAERLERGHFCEDLKKTPGPGTYNLVETNIYKNRSPQYSIILRNPLPESKTQYPGPDKYTLPPVLGPKTVTVRTAPSALIAERLERGHFCEDLKKTPGPGTYNLVETNIYKNRSPQYSIILRNPLPESKTQYPGPDKYTLPPVLGPKTVTVRTAPSALIAERLERGHFCEDLKKTPGPGTYNLVETNIYKNRSPQYSIILRNPLPESKTQYPGPDKYTLPPVLGPKTVTVRTAPSALIAERLERGHFCEDLKKTPGPGTYNVVETNVYQKRSPQYSIILRNPLPESKTQYPGPDKYTLPPVLGPKTVTVRTAPSALIAERLERGHFCEDLKKTPGPGTYNVVETNVYSKRSPQYSIVVRNTLPGNRTPNPGPAAYFPDVCPTKPKLPMFSFGVRHSEYLAPLIVDKAH